VAGKTAVVRGGFARFGTFRPLAWRAGKKLRCQWRGGGGCRAPTRPRTRRECVGAELDRRTGARGGGKATVMTGGGDGRGGETVAAVYRKV
jgi:hypothetical protein